jgi:hypothetical protein
MNCYSQCYNFFKTNSEKDLGNIKNQGDCAYCLYWDNGPGRPLYQNSNCECNKLFVTNSNIGTKFNVNSFNDVKNCLKNAKKCGVMYSNFTNTPYTFQSPDFEIKPCDKDKLWRKKFKYQGVV